MQRRRLKVEEKELDFEFEVVNVQFNQLGQYLLVLTVENPLLDDPGTGVQLRISDGDILPTNSGHTETIDQTSLDDFYPCMHNRFIFTLPKGFCKNDKNHDVRLKVEALRMTDSKDKDGTKAGEGFFAIYPRTNAPRINLFAGQGEELYQYSGIMALLRVHTDYLSMHCGRLVYTVAFHEARPFLKNGGSPSHIPSVPGSDHSDGEASSGPNTLQVPHLTLGSSQHQNSISVSQELSTPGGTEPSPIPPPSPQPQTQHQQLDDPSPKPDLHSSSDSLPSTPRSGAASTQEQCTQKPNLDGVLLLPLEISPSQSPEPFPYTQVIESPLRSEMSFADDFHVSSPGKEDVTIILHGATSLPPLSDGGVPQPFAIVKSGVDEARGRRSRGVTHCTLQPTHCPSWEERLSVELQEQQPQEEAVVLCVADSRTKELLAHYRLPVGHLRPFHHYHLELVQAHRSVPYGVRLYVTVVRKVSLLPRLPCFSFTGLEVLLQSVEKPLKEAVGPLLVVARIVSDYPSYRDTVLLHTPRTAGIAMTTVHFPQPLETTFHPPPLTAQGRPQVSPAGSPEGQPVWNHCFLFVERDCATIFTGAAALVLEYYPITTVMNRVSWHIRGPLGFSALPLHQQLYRKLMSERGQRGAKVEQIPLRGSSLQTTTDTTPSVSVLLRLIGSERPDSLLTAVDPSLLPCLDLDLELDTEPLEETEWTPTAEPPLPPLPSQTDTEEGTSTPRAPPRANPDHHTHTQPQPQLSLQQDGHSLPPYDALAQILPDYQYLFSTARPQPHASGQQGQDRPGGKAEATQSNKSGPPLPDFEDDPHLAEVTDLQTKEVENYRTAMRKMAEDIIALRAQVVSLESDNSRLRSDLTLHQDLGRNLLDDTDIDVMTKAEIADRIGSLTFKLASESSKAVSQRDKIQQLQNDLIRKNDSEKELLRLQKAHQQQQATLQRYQSRMAKMGGLEATVKQQEKVIEKMEKVLDKKLTEKNKENAERKKLLKKQTVGEDDNRKAEMESALAAENSRLRGELDKLRHQPAPIIIQQPTQTREVFPDKERLSLLSKQEKAEARVRTLETQLEENSKRWGRQKQEMLTRLSEQNYGFARTSTTILHDVSPGRSRRRQLKPPK